MILTEEVLRKHTKLQERVMCEEDDNESFIGKHKNIGSHHYNLKRVHPDMDNVKDDEPIAKKSTWSVPSAVNALNVTTTKPHTSSKAMPALVLKGYTQYPFRQLDMTKDLCFPKTFVTQNPCTFMAKPNGAGHSLTYQWPRCSQTGNNHLRVRIR